MNTALMFSTGKDDWRTPPDLFARLNAEFGFTLDVAASAENSLCEEWLSEGPGGGALGESWAHVQQFSTPICWCNPPYSRGLQGKFIAKASLERVNGVTTVMLLPARTDTKAFHTYIWNDEEHRPYRGVEVRFLKGRLRFVGAPSSAPFPSMIVIFRGAEDVAERRIR